MEEYRSGRLVLLQAAALAGASGDEEGEDEDAEDVSQRNMLPGTDEEGDTAEGGELQLVEREDLPGYVVQRGPGASGSDRRPGALGRAGARRPMFRWRPLMQFHNWVGRTQINDVPPDERATVRRQLTEIKDALEKQLAQLDQLEKGQPATQAQVPGEESGTEKGQEVHAPS